ncbi:MAG: hypothetical protein JW956_04395 [Calditrichaceae bacterium]|nr:hypothetical protein [Calditrichaceae bacterium]
MKTQINIILILLFYFSLVNAQMEKYNFKREINGVTDTWHKISLPDDLFGKVQNSLNDIRIYGITDQDTLEAPYILKTLTGLTQWIDIPFKLLNQSHNQNEYYFTFKLFRDEIINQINLNFSNSNFDWRINLEGSQNQHKWYTIIEDYRILSIQNEMINYAFTTLKIPDSHYKYYRLSVPSSEQPKFSSAKIYDLKVVEGKYRDYPVMAKRVNTNDKYNQTVIEVSLPMPVPVSFVKLSVSDKIDYYRPLSIQYLLDSVKTEKGWKYNYISLVSGTLSSLEDNEYNFNQRITNKLKVIIKNYDNQPLNIETVTVKGYVHELIARFNKPAQYYLVYGNKRAYKPNYDIINFQKNIPRQLSALNLDKEISIQKTELPIIGPLFSNPAWLWVIMIIIILVLGWFSIRMLKGKS